jgi:hypothetical protein
MVKVNYYFIVLILYLFQLIDYSKSNQFSLLDKLRDKSVTKKITTLSSNNNNIEINPYNNDDISLSSQNDINMINQYTSILNSVIVGNFKIWHLLLICLVLWVVIGKTI